MKHSTEKRDWHVIDSKEGNMMELHVMDSKKENMKTVQKREICMS